MDPGSRRFVWKHIDEIKEGRVVLLVRKPVAGLEISQMC